LPPTSQRRKLAFGAAREGGFGHPILDREGRDQRQTRRDLLTRAATQTADGTVAGRIDEFELAEQLIFAIHADNPHIEGTRELPRFRKCRCARARANALEEHLFCWADLGSNVRHPHRFRLRPDT
jgi:hypothetical protein